MANLFQRILSYFRNIEMFGFATGAEAVSSVQTTEAFEKRVAVEYLIRERNYGLHYAGHVGFAGRRFDFDLVFAVPIPEIRRLAEARDPQELRSRFRLKIQREGKDIELSDEEYGVFLELLVDRVVQFHGLDSLMDNWDMDLRPGATAVITSKEMSTTTNCCFPMRVLELLCKPQFGCEF